MRLLGLVILFVLGAVTSVCAGDYNYISAKDMKSRIETGSDVIIVDIQIEKEFKQHHLPGSIATYAYPVKTEAERAQIDKAVQRFQESGKDVVIVCPRGEGGAKRCYDYMKKNVPSEKIYILEKGIAGWPYHELLQKG
ncbi:rhodanese-like domain-containing protein [Desulfopila aestuarii]|uniref:Rhodanese-related sulfurtransferase n=1 Tax=Desulfopila aestuarii DSM 18488 TaxID=1121416 RepID=A0A1M7YI20_9BACT|nr:rhodanese-like domain-containing protein [Desulfopila aestuarii]SHO52246.1 Rhodanese-related sulfurtransferase [Desulfopila aestuarii DSM 18488]